MFIIYRYREFAPQEYEKRNLIQVPEDDYQAYEPQVAAYQDPNQILFKRSKLQTFHAFIKLKVTEPSYQSERISSK